MIVFHLQRDTDVSGVSGTGVVADGVIWPDGTVSVRWRGEHPSIVFWRSIESVKAIHGHNGATQIVLPVSERERLGRIADAHHAEVGPGGLTSGLCTECGHAWPCPSYVWATTGRDPLACWDPADDEPLPEGEPPAPDLQEVLRADIRAIVEESGLKQVAIARKLGITPKHLSQMLTGRVTLNVRWAEQIARVCGRRLSVTIRPAGAEVLS